MNKKVNTSCLLLVLIFSHLQLSCGRQSVETKSSGLIDTQLPTTAKPIDFNQELRTPPPPLLIEEEVGFQNDIMPQQKETAKSPDLIPDKTITPQNHDTEEATLAFCSDDQKSKLTQKKAFVCFLLPAAIRLNKIVYRQRLQIIALENKSKSMTLSQDESQWLEKIKIQYGLKLNASTSDLLTRVDIVPLALLLAQGAIESGWGTSRIALQGKNYFGIHGNRKFDTCLPAAQNSSVCVKKYNSADEGISDYILFLNTMTSAQNFRLKRAEMRAKKVTIDPLVLVKTLQSYSERGNAYITQVSNMMVGQNFIQYVFTENELSP